MRDAAPLTRSGTRTGVTVPAEAPAAEPPQGQPEKGGEKREKTKKEGGGGKGPGGKSEIDYGPDFRYIVRIADADLDGKKSIDLALAGIRGIGLRTAAIVADKVGIPANTKIGTLTDAQLEQVVGAITDLRNYAPEWMLNRRSDWVSGDNLHLVGNEIPTFLRDDINRMKKIRCYRGVRHERGKKVRGQRTSSNGRKGLAIGVIRKVGAPEGGGGEKKDK